MAVKKARRATTARKAGYGPAKLNWRGKTIGLRHPLRWVNLRIRRAIGIKRTRFQKKRGW